MASFTVENNSNVVEKNNKRKIDVVEKKKKKKKTQHLDLEIIENKNENEDATEKVKKKKKKEKKNVKIIESKEEIAEGEKTNSIPTTENSKVTVKTKTMKKVQELPTVSIAVPGSILDNAQSPEFRTYLAGQIARAACIYKIDEVCLVFKINCIFTIYLTNFIIKYFNFTCNLFLLGCSF